MRARELGFGTKRPQRRWEASAPGPARRRQAGQAGRNGAAPRPARPYPGARGANTGIPLRYPSSWRPGWQPILPDAAAASSAKPDVPRSPASAPRRSRSAGRDLGEWRSGRKPLRCTGLAGLTGSGDGDGAPTRGPQDGVRAQGPRLGIGRPTHHQGSRRAAGPSPGRDHPRTRGTPSTWRLR
jgi:hypothetical protein